MLSWGEIGSKVKGGGRKDNEDGEKPRGGVRRKKTCYERKGFQLLSGPAAGGKMTPAVNTFGGKKSVACRDVVSIHSVSHQDSNKKISKTGMKGGTGGWVGRVTTYLGLLSADAYMRSLWEGGGHGRRVTLIGWMRDKEEEEEGKEEERRDSRGTSINHCWSQLGWDDRHQVIKLDIWGDEGGWRLTRCWMNSEISGKHLQMCKTQTGRWLKTQNVWMDQLTVERFSFGLRSPPCGEDFNTPSMNTIMCLNQIHLHTWHFIFYVNYKLYINTFPCKSLLWNSR